MWDDHVMKPFAWSYSKLKNWRTCPRRHNEIDIKKTFKEAKSSQLVWGDHFHHEIANRLATRKLMQPNMQQYEPLAQRYDAVSQALETKPHVELQLACDRAMKPTGYFATDVWVRAKVDLLILKPPVAMVVDWKTGAMKPDSEQLALTAAVIMAHHPDVEWVITKYVWIGEPKWPETIEHYHRAPSRYEIRNGTTYAMHNVQDLWRNIGGDIQAMEKAHATGEYPPNPTGLCRRYCPVTTCEFHGKGGY
jgi:RecB family exonuclease